MNIEHNLTDQEKKLFAFFKHGDVVHLDDIARNMPGVTRHSLIVRIKYLTAKLAPDGLIISKVTSVGRGAKAIYRMERRFT